MKNIDKAIDYLQSLGMGPFQGPGGARWGEIVFRGELHGKPEEWKVKISNAQMGDAQLELLEPSGGRSALQESLDATGEGLHHIGYLVDDLDVEIARGVSQGLKVWTMSRPEKRPGFVYFEPTKVAGIAIELRTK